VALSVCYHDNSKLRASIFTKLGLLVNVVTVSSLLNFGRPVPPERGSVEGEMFGSALLQPARSVCVSPSVFSSFCYIINL